MSDEGVENALEEFLPAPYPAPLFAAGVQQLDFGEVRKPARKRMTFKVSNIGGEGNLEVTLTPNIPNQQWFRVRPSVVVIPAGEDCIVDAEVDTCQETCPLGKQDLDIQVEAPASMVQEIPRIRVTVEVLPEIKLVTEPSVVDFGEVPLGESRTIAVTISRTDDREVYLNERLLELVDDSGQRRPAWADLKVGDPGRQQVVEITFHTANRAMREYHCELRLAHVAPEVNPIAAPIRVRVGPPPELQLKWAIEPLPLFTGDSQEAQLAVGNSGGGVLRGRITGDQYWLRVGSGEFEVAASDAKWVGIRIGDSRLKAGTYNGLLEIFSNDGGRSRVNRIPIELEVEGEDACPVEIVMETELGQLVRGQKAQRTLTIRNRMARPFEGRLSSSNPEWIRPQAGSEGVKLGPGEMKQVALDIDTRALPAAEGTTNHMAFLQLVDVAGREQWKGGASLKLLPAARTSVRWVAAALGLLLLLALAFLALRGRGGAPAPARPAATAANPARATPPASSSARPSGSALAPEAQPATATSPSEEPDPEKARALYAKGMARFRAKKWKDAADSFSQAARVDPDPAGSYVMVARSRYQLGQWPLATQALKSALEEKPDSATAHLWLGKVYARQGSRQAARREFQAALKAAPNDRQAQDELRKLR